MKLYKDHKKIFLVNSTSLCFPSLMGKEKLHVVLHMITTLVSYNPTIMLVIFQLGKT